MVPLKTRRHHLGARSLLAVGLLSLAAMFAAGYASAAGPGQPKPAGADVRLRELLTQRYQILRQMAENSQRLFETGRLDILAYQNLTDALYRAQADLSTTTAEQIQVYEKLVEALSANDRLAERQAEAGRLVTLQVMQVKLVTLNAEIYLERLRLGQPISPPQPAGSRIGELSNP